MNNDISKRSHLLKRACKIISAITLLLSSQLFAQTNLALNKPATASSAITPASYAVDGNATTRWESTHGVDNSWLQIDLGAINNLTSMAIDWEAANPANYQVLGSNDTNNWVTLSTRTGGTFGARTDTITLSGSYRYIKINCTLRSTGNTWGYSIWETRVFGTTPPPPTNVALNKTVTTNSALQAAANAVDGNATTRWESVQSATTAWLQVDLGANYILSSTSIDWEAANAANYDIQGSINGSSWSTLATRTGGTFGVRTDTLALSGSYRYLRVNATQKSVGNNWGYSIWEWRVSGVIDGGGSSSPSSVSSSSKPSSSSLSSSSIISSNKSSSSSSSKSSLSSSKSSSSSSVSLSSSSSSWSSDRNRYDAPRATTAPIIDGQMDAIWSIAPWAPIDVFWLGSQHPTAADFSGRYKAMWDAGNLYLLFDITDDVLFDATANPLDRYWDDDSVEIFIDENHNGGNHQYNTSAWAYHVSTLGDVVDFTNSTTPQLLNDHITVRRVSNGTKHMWEMSMRVYGENYVDGQVNIPVTLFAGKLMGFSVCYNDNDASANRESMIGSVDTQGHKNDQGYIDASVFGTMRLLETVPTP